MPRYLISLRRDQRKSAKPTAEAVRQFPNVSIVQIHSPEMVTVEATDAAVEKLREAIGSIYHIEPEIRRGLHENE